jgi:predicted dehydrogenase
MMTRTAKELSTNGHTKPRGKPRLGFLGVGWIGRNRLQAIVDAGAAEIVAMTEPANEMSAAAQQIAPDAKLIMSYDELMAADLDGVVIATPSAMHADQSIAALERGLAVFCQKPLARNANETWRVVDAARKADKLIGVDLSYRHIDGVAEIKDLVGSGALGDVFAVDLVFHNAYGPDKKWFYDPELSGGGCLIDLGIHLVDLAMWVLDFPSVHNVSSRLFCGGKPLSDGSGQVEDYAAAQFDMDRNIHARLACSWNLNAGRDAVIEATFYGTNGAASLKNENGSFFEFSTEWMEGTTSARLDDPEKQSFDWDWGGRAAVEWVNRLGESPRFDTSATNLINVAEVIDTIYTAASTSSRALAK